MIAKLKILIFYIPCRYSSRCLLIKFSSPVPSGGVRDFEKFLKLYESVSSSIGFCVSTGEEFFKSGIDEVDAVILPELKRKANNVIPRVMPSYAFLFWFATKVSVSLILFLKPDHFICVAFEGSPNGVHCRIDCTLYRTTWPSFSSSVLHRRSISTAQCISS